MTNRAIVLYDDAAARALEPFALTRPTSEFRTGAVLLRDRWARHAYGAVRGRVGAPHLDSFDEPGTPRTIRGEIDAGTVVANSRFAPMLGVPLVDADAWMADGRVAAVRLSAPLDADCLQDGSLALESLVPPGARTAMLDGWWIDRAWDLVRHLNRMLLSDLPVIGATIATQRVSALDGVRIVGAHDIFIEDGAVVEPFVLLDAQPGPLLVRRGAHVQAFTRLVGPCVVGTDSVVHGGRVSGSSIGEQCRVRGEVSASVFFGQSNKAHDGFLGHSVVGRWANLGAGTTTSNLKNSYGTVRMWAPGGTVDTGMQFLGSLIGDHAKLAIGTLLRTGSLVGAGANVFGGSSPDRVVPPFSWGGVGDTVFDLVKFLEIATHVHARRGEPLSDGLRQVLAAAHKRRWTA